MRHGRLLGALAGVLLVAGAALAQQTFTVQVTLTAPDLQHLRQHYNMDGPALQVFFQRKLELAVRGIVDQQTQSEAGVVLQEYLRAPESVRAQMRALVPARPPAERVVDPTPHAP